MKTKTISFALVAVTAISLPLAAQRRDAPNRRSVSAERVLQMRGRLELTEEQIIQLNEIRTGELERRTADMVHRMEIESRLAAGELTRAEAQAQIRERRGVTPDVDNDAVGRVRGILSEEQRTTLQASARRGGRGQARQGRRGERRSFQPSRGRGSPGVTGGGRNRRARSRVPRRRRGNI